MAQVEPAAQAPTLRARRVGIDTYQEPVVYMRSDCAVCRSEGFEVQSRIRIEHDGRSVIATLNVVRDHLIELSEAGLSEAAWRALDLREGDTISLTHPKPLQSLSHVRRKIYGHHLETWQINEIVEDIAARRYSDVELACFISGCSARGLSTHETVALTRAMIAAGETLDWGQETVVDKHCVGGLPGNRTTIVIVPIVAAFGLTMPKTSSRAITSPAGTADAMETIAPVDLSTRAMRDVVEREGACIVWGGSVQLSPADDILIRVERVLDLDTEGQLIASVLSKKAAAGSTHVVIDIPVGRTAKIRSERAAESLAENLRAVASEIGLHLHAHISDGTQPVGRGIGPALEARDVLAVLRNEPDAPRDLRERSLDLAGAIIELSGRVAPGDGKAIARRLLESGDAYRKFEAICEAQGGMREPKAAAHTSDVLAPESGIVSSIDNRQLARIAKLAGAPQDATAGVTLHVSVDSRVEKGQPLFTLHSAARGELDYALNYEETGPPIITIAPA